MTCERCKKNCNTFRMSWLNTQMICEDCQEKERTHPQYAQAKERERKEVMAGNYNYPGILAEKER